MKHNNNKVVFANKNTDKTYSNIDINLLTQECIQTHLIKSKKIIKTLYK